MGETAEFIDYYALLQVSPDCDGKILEKAYHHFALKYHPDHAETANVERFQEVVEAYNVLRDPEKRAEYNQEYKLTRGDNVFAFPGSEDAGIEQKSALADAEAHQKILMHLYKRRREHAGQPGVVGFYVQQLLNCSDETFEFHLWYLKSKGLIEMNEQAELTITIEGVDHVISMSRTAEAEKLLLGQTKSEQE
ncbi:MAG: DnaJ domain-containing protein [Erythrobacter sp.]